MVEERDPGLEGNRHGHAVELDQDIVHQVPRHVGVQLALQAHEAGGVRLGQAPPVEAEAVAALHHLRRIPAVQRAPLGQIPEHPPAGVLEILRPPQSFRESLGLVDRPLLPGRGRKTVQQAVHQPPRRGVREPPDAIGPAVGAVVIVAAEQLVAAVARERHSHLAPRQLRNHERGKGRHVAERLVEVSGEALGHLHDPRLHQLRVVGGSEALGDQRGVGQLVVGAVFEAEREGAYPPRGLGAHQAHDDARVDAPREKSPERHVRHQPAADRCVEPFPEAPGRLVNRRGPVARVRPPEAPGLHPPVILPPEHPGPGRDFGHVAHDGPRGRDELVGEEVVDRLEIPLHRNGGVGDDRLELRAEHHTLEAIIDIQRLDAQPVPGEEQLARPGVPDGKGEHSVESFHARRAPLLEGVHDGLGVAAGAEPVAPGLQLAAQIGVIVDLAVVDQLDGAVLVGHRLVAAGGIHDAQPGHAQRQRALDPIALLVGASVPERPAHRFENGPRRRPPRPHVPVSRDAAHRQAAARRAAPARVTCSSSPRSASR